MTDASVIDFDRPSIARVYDYVLGGKEHFEVDRQAAHSILDIVPEASQIAVDNRDFLRRSIRYLVADAGIRQMVDIGSGLPTSNNVHEVAQAIDPDVRVVYVDIDPVVLAHGRALLTNGDTTAMVSGDVREPDTIFDDPVTCELIDYGQPFAVLVSGVLHHLSDAEDPYAATSLIKDRLGSGSYLLLSNFLDDEPVARSLERAFLRSGLGTGRFRTWAEQQRFFEGLEMVDPGLVYADDWKPDEVTPTESPVRTLYAGGIGRKA